jgi:hypothetical protein
MCLFQQKRCELGFWSQKHNLEPLVSMLETKYLHDTIWTKQMKSGQNQTKVKETSKHIPLVKGKCVEVHGESPRLPNANSFWECGILRCLTTLEQGNNDM